jgi:23S rRNA (guanosine2251-2'-O)-methyltransferase
MNKFNKKKTHQKTKSDSGNSNKFKKQKTISDLKYDRIIVGQHSILEALTVNPSWISSAWLRKGFESSQDLKKIEKLLNENKISYLVKSEEDFDRLARAHQGAALFATQRPEIDLQSLAEQDDARILFLDQIEDPQNLGAILRTAWLMKVSAVFITDDNSVKLTPTVHKVASGAAEHVPVVIVNQFSSTIDLLKEQGFWIYGLSHRAKSNVFQIDFPKKVALIVGSEEKGMRSTTEKLCDDLVSIPQNSAAASYNASVALAMSLSEVYRQQFFYAKK